MDSIFFSLSQGSNFKQKRKVSPAIANEEVRQEKTKIGKSNHEEESEEEEKPVIPLHNEDLINEFRNRLQIKVKGSQIPKPVPTFREMTISPEIKSVLLRNIEASDWKEPTPIQMQAIPILLANRDLLASAPTGSGKTAAFVIPLLSKLQQSRKIGIRAMMLAPTRELAEQIYRETSRLCVGKRINIGLVKKSVVTSAALDGQNTMAYSKFDVIISTPMRIVALLRASAIDLRHVETIILDEADKLFELDSHQPHSGPGSEPGLEPEEEEEEPNPDFNSRSSFLSQVDEILAACSEGVTLSPPSATSSSQETKTNKNKNNNKKSKKNPETDMAVPSTGKVLQRALFSATIGPFVQELADSFLQNPIRVLVGQENSGAPSIQQKLIFAGREDGKILALRNLIQEGRLTPPALLFTQSIDRAKELYRELAFDGINVEVMHSDRSATQRENIINRFRVGEIWILICTDLMARGVDFKAVKMIINYDLPQSAVSYIHRIGRTGRGGREGEAITFFTEEDIPFMRSIVNVMKLSGSEVPEWLLSVKQLSTKKKRKLRLSAPERRPIDQGLNAYDKKRLNKKKQIILQSKQKKERIEHPTPKKRKAEAVAEDEENR